jgi:hypothetical protein
MGFWDAQRNVAHACPGTALVIEALTPPSGAQNVPLNTALIGKSNLHRLTFQLRRSGSAAEIPLSVSCDGHYDGNLCLAYAGLLSPNTDYEWSMAVADADPMSQPFLNRFTTGSALDPVPPLIGREKLTVLEHQKMEGHNTCGYVSFSKVRFDFEKLDEPVVFALDNRNGTYRARVLYPGQPQAEEMLVNAWPSINGRLIDFAGNTRFLQFDFQPPQPPPPPQPQPEAPPQPQPGPASQPDPPSQQPTSPPPSLPGSPAGRDPELAPGCTLGRPQATSFGPPVLGAAAALLAAIRRRRRAP